MTTNQKRNGPEKRGQRIFREQCTRVTHDTKFSEWKILVGPTDWKDYAAGVPGVSRYRVQNLPQNYFGSGVYELGLVRGQLAESRRRLRPEDVLVVYLGQAKSVRDRLQQYGKDGSHLGIAHNSKSSSASSAAAHHCSSAPDGSQGACEARSRCTGVCQACKNARQGGAEAKAEAEEAEGCPHAQGTAGIGRGLGCAGWLRHEACHISGANLAPAADWATQKKSGGASMPSSHGMFEQAFGMGYAVAFRWSMTPTKEEAVEAEAALLNHFDYLWNLSQNGARRQLAHTPPSSGVPWHRSLNLNKRIMAPLSFAFEAFSSSSQFHTHGPKIAALHKPTGNHGSSAPPSTCSSPLPAWLLATLGTPSEQRKQAGLEPPSLNSVCGGTAHGTGHVEEGGKQMGGRKERKGQGRQKGLAKCRGEEVTVGFAVGERYGTFDEVLVSPMDQPGSTQTSGVGDCKFPGNGVLGSMRQSSKTAAVCMALLKDGSTCQALASKGRKRCSEHKGRRAGHV